VSWYGISSILVHLLYSYHSVTLGPTCLIFCIYTLDTNVFPRSQNKHFGLIFHNPSSRVYHISFSEMLACLCFFSTLGSSIALIATQFIFEKALCFFLPYPATFCTVIFLVVFSFPSVLFLANLKKPQSSFMMSMLTIDVSLSDFYCEIIFQWAFVSPLRQLTELSCEEKKSYAHFLAFPISSITKSWP